MDTSDLIPLSPAGATSSVVNSQDGMVNSQDGMVNSQDGMVNSQDGMVTMCSINADPSITDCRPSDKISPSNSEYQTSDSSDDSPDMTSQLGLSMHDSTLTLAASFEKHMERLLHKQRLMMDLIASGKPAKYHPVVPENKPKVYEMIIRTIPDINKSIIGFCNDVPGFSSLCKSDGETLVKRAYYDIWMVTNSRMFRDGESYLMFNDGTVYSRGWMESILNKYMVSKIMAYAD
ncbi:uncharacterized protein LOC106013656, partial [Aplysia californica]|uniref:Uncharacterized protein LOC106013656 n=1 Tax=Aplysia californica TaxID=6500 RepID=A0ABM1AD40_APLCA